MTRSTGTGRRSSKLVHPKAGTSSRRLVQCSPGMPAAEEPVVLPDPEVTETDELLRAGRRRAREGGSHEEQGSAGVTQVASDVPQDLIDLYGKDQYPEVSEIPVEHGYIWTSCASVENGNPDLLGRGCRADDHGGPIAPPSMVSVWFRPHHWAPGRSQQLLPLQVHFDLKERLDLPEAVMTDDTIEFHAPVRVGDLLQTHQVLRSVSAAKTTKLGAGRFWVIDVVYRNQRDELVAVETYTGFGYQRAAGPAPASVAAPSAGVPPAAARASGAGSVDSSAAPTPGSIDMSDTSREIEKGYAPRLLAGDVKAGDHGLRS